MQSAEKFGFLSFINTCKTCFKAIKSLCWYLFLKLCIVPSNLNYNLAGNVPLVTNLFHIIFVLYLLILFWHQESHFIDLLWIFLGFPLYVKSVFDLAFNIFSVTMFGLRHSVNMSWIFSYMIFFFPFFFCSQPWFFFFMRILWASSIWCLYFSTMGNSYLWLFWATALYLIHLSVLHGLFILIAFLLNISHSLNILFPSFHIFPSFVIF